MNGFIFKYMNKIYKVYDYETYIIYEIIGYFYDIKPNIYIDNYFYRLLEYTKKDLSCSDYKKCYFELLLIYYKTNNYDKLYELFILFDKHNILRYINEYISKSESNIHKYVNNFIMNVLQEDYDEYTNTSICNIS